MSKLPVVSGLKVVKALSKIGYEVSFSFLSSRFLDVKRSHPEMLYLP